MRTLTINRLKNQPIDDGTFGVMTDERGWPLFVTFEETWRHNERNVSCVPEGTYVVERALTPKHGDTWRLRDVQGRDNVLIHVINTEADTEGCIGLGVEFGSMQAKDDQSGQVEWQPAILRSREAIDRFNAMMRDEREFVLVINW